MPRLLRRTQKAERREQYAQSGASSDDTGDGGGDMLTDRYGLAVSTSVAAARDAYVEGVDLLLTVYPGAASSFDRAIAADPDFALPHVGKARAFQLAGNLAAMRESLATALSLSDGASVRDRSHIDVFR